MVSRLGQKVVPSPQPPVMPDAARAATAGAYHASEGNVAEAGVGAFGEVEGPGQEHRHLGSGDGAVGAVVGAVAAASGDAEVGHALNEWRMEAGWVHVVEPGL